MQTRSKREKRLEALMDRPPPARYATRRGRRELVVLGAATLALLWIDAAVCWVLAPSDAAMYTTFAVLGVAIVAGAAVWGTLGLSVRGTIGLPEHLLDERQLRERLSAHATAHRLTALLLIVTYFVVIMALPSGESGAVPSAAVTVLFLALVATVWTLPMLVVAWRLPDPPIEDE